MLDLIPNFTEKPFAIYQGDVLDILPHLQVKVDCVVTSPPYFNQRRYGSDSKEIGQQKLINEFIDSLVKVFALIPVEPWANYWINIGNKRDKNGALWGVPNRFVIAMQDAGFHLMDEVIWAKEVVDVEGKHTGHCMIEPAKGRLNGNGWEPFYRFVKNPELAWSDTCAVMIDRDNHPSPRYRPEGLMQCFTAIEGRNLTNVWSVSNSSKGKGHFAAMPAVLCERPIAMSCPELITEKGPRERLITPTVYDEGRKSKRVFGQYKAVEELHRPDEEALSEEERSKLEEYRCKSGRMDTARHYIPKFPLTTGWSHEDLPVLRRGIVLDPFGGTGTTGEVAIKLGRNFIGIDLYEEFATRMEERCDAAWRLFCGNEDQI